MRQIYYQPLGQIFNIVCLYGKSFQKYIDKKISKKLLKSLESTINNELETFNKFYLYGFLNVKNIKVICNINENLKRYLSKGRRMKDKHSKINEYFCIL